MDHGNNTEGLKLGQDRATETLYLCLLRDPSADFLVMSFSWSLNKIFMELCKFCVELLLCL